MNLSVTHFDIRVTESNVERDDSRATSRGRASTLSLPDSIIREVSENVDENEDDWRRRRRSQQHRSDNEDEDVWTDDDLVLPLETSLVKSLVKSAPMACRAGLRRPMSILSDIKHNGFASFALDKPRRNGKSSLFAHEGNLVAIRNNQTVHWYEHGKEDEEGKEWRELGFVRVEDVDHKQGAFSLDGKFFAFVHSTSQVTVAWSGAVVSTLVVTEAIKGVAFMASPASTDSTLVIIGQTGRVWLGDSSSDYTALSECKSKSNSSINENRSIDFAFVLSDGRFVFVFPDRVEIWLLEWKTRILTQFQSLRTFDSDLTSYRIRLADYARAKAGLRGWVDLLRVKRSRVSHDETRLVLVNGLGEIRVLEIQNGKQLGLVVESSGLISSKVDFIRLLDGSLALAMAVKDSIMLSYVSPSGIKKLNEQIVSGTYLEDVASMGTSIVFLDEDGQLGSVWESSPEETLRGLLQSRDFDSAMRFCALHELSTDIVHKFVFDSSPVSSESISVHLEKVKDVDWVLKTCFGRIPAESGDLCLELLKFGRRLSASSTRITEGSPSPHDFDSLIERTEAFLTVFRDVGFDASALRRFRDVPDVLTVAKRLAADGRAEEVIILVFETRLGGRLSKLPMEDRLSLLDSFSEIVDPSRYGSLLVSFAPPPSWYVGRSIAIEARTGLVHLSIKLLDLCPSLHFEEIKDIKHSIEVFSRIALDDFDSLSFSKWSEMNELEKIRTIWTRCDSQVDTLAIKLRLVMPSVPSPPPLVLPWLKALKEFIVHELKHPSHVTRFLLDDTNADLLYRNRLDGRVFLLECARDCMERFALNVDHVSAIRQFLVKLDLLNGDSTEKAAPKRFSPLRADLADLSKRLDVYEKSFAGLAAIASLASLKSIDEALVLKIASEVDSLASFHNVLFVADFAKISLSPVRRRVVKSLLMSRKKDVVAQIVSSLLKQKEHRRRIEEDCIEASLDAGREFLARDDLVASKESLQAIGEIEDDGRIARLNGFVDFLQAMRTEEGVTELVALEQLLLFDRDPVAVLTKVLSEHRFLVMSPAPPNASTPPIQGPASARETSFFEHIKRTLKTKSSVSTTLKQKIDRWCSLLSLSADESDFITCEVVLKRLILSSSDEENLVLASRLIGEISGDSPRVFDVLWSLSLMTKEPKEASARRAQALLRCGFEGSVDERRHLEMLDSLGRFLPRAFVEIPTDDLEEMIREFHSTDKRFLNSSPEELIADKRRWMCFVSTVASGVDLESILSELDMEAIQSESQLKTLLAASCLRDRKWKELSALGTKAGLVESTSRLLFLSRQEAESLVQRVRGGNDATEGSRKTSLFDEDKFESEGEYRLEVLMKLPSSEEVPPSLAHLPCQYQGLALDQDFVRTYARALKDKRIDALMKVQLSDDEAKFIASYPSDEDFFSSDMLFHLQTLKLAMRDRDDIDSTRTKVEEFVSKFAPHLRESKDWSLLRRLGVARPTFLDSHRDIVAQDDALVAVSEAFNLAPPATDPLRFAKAVAELSSSGLRPSQVLLACLLTTLFGGWTSQATAQEEAGPGFVLAAARKSYETKCRPYMSKLVAQDLGEFAWRTCFATSKLDMSTRRLIAEDCLSCARKLRSKPIAAGKGRKSSAPEEEEESGGVYGAEAVSTKREVKTASHEIVDSTIRALQDITGLIRLESHEDEDLRNEMTELFDIIHGHAWSLAAKSSLVQSRENIASKFILSLTKEELEALVPTAFDESNPFLLSVLCSKSFSPGSRLIFALPESILEAAKSKDAPRELLGSLVRLGLVEEARLAQAKEDDVLRESRAIATGAGWTEFEDWRSLLVVPLGGPDTIDAAWRILDLSASSRDGGGEAKVIERLLISRFDFQRATRSGPKLSVETRRAIAQRWIDELGLALVEFLLDDSLWFEAVEENLLAVLGQFKDKIDPLKVLRRFALGDTLKVVSTPQRLGEIVVAAQSLEFAISASRVICEAVIMSEPVLALDVLGKHRCFPLGLLQTASNTLSLVRHFLSSLLEGVETGTSQLVFDETWSATKASNLIRNALVRAESTDWLPALEALGGIDRGRDQEDEFEPTMPKSFQETPVRQTAKTPLKPAKGEWEWNEDDFDSPVRPSKVETRPSEKTSKTVMTEAATSKTAKPIKLKAKRLSGPPIPSDVDMLLTGPSSKSVSASSSDADLLLSSSSKLAAGPTSAPASLLPSRPAPKPKTTSKAPAASFDASLLMSRPSVRPKPFLTTDNVDLLLTGAGAGSQSEKQRIGKSLEPLVSPQVTGESNRLDVNNRTSNSTDISVSEPNHEAWGGDDEILDDIVAPHEAWGDHGEIILDDIVAPQSADRESSSKDNAWGGDDEILDDIVAPQLMDRESSPKNKAWGGDDEILDEIVAPQPASPKHKAWGDGDEILDDIAEGAIGDVTGTVALASEGGESDASLANATPPSLSNNPVPSNEADDDVAIADEISPKVEDEDVIGKPSFSDVILASGVNHSDTVGSVSSQVDEGDVVILPHDENTVDDVAPRHENGDFTPPDQNDETQTGDDNARTTSDSPVIEPPQEFARDDVGQAAVQESSSMADNQVVGEATSRTIEPWEGNHQEPREVPDLDTQHPLETSSSADVLLPATEEGYSKGDPDIATQSKHAGLELLLGVSTVESASTHHDEDESEKELWASDTLGFDSSMKSVIEDDAAGLLSSKSKTLDMPIAEATHVRMGSVSPVRDQTETAVDAWGAADSLGLDSPVRDQNEAAADAWGAADSLGFDSPRRDQTEAAVDAWGAADSLGLDSPMKNEDKDVPQRNEPFLETNELSGGWAGESPELVSPGKGREDDGAVDNGRKSDEPNIPMATHPSLTLLRNAEGEVLSTKVPPHKTFSEEFPQSSSVRFVPEEVSRLTAGWINETEEPPAADSTADQVMLLQERHVEKPASLFGNDDPEIQPEAMGKPISEPNKPISGEESKASEGPDSRESAIDVPQPVSSELGPLREPKAHNLSGPETVKPDSVESKLTGQFATSDSGSLIAQEATKGPVNVKAKRKVQTPVVALDVLDLLGSSGQHAPLSKTPTKPPLNPSPKVVATKKSALGAPQSHTQVDVIDMFLSPSAAVKSSAAHSSTSARPTKQHQDPLDLLLGSTLPLHSSPTTSKADPLDLNPHVPQPSASMTHGEKPDVIDPPTSASSTAERLARDWDEFEALPTAKAVEVAPISTTSKQPAIVSKVKPKSKPAKVPVETSALDFLLGGGPAPPTASSAPKPQARVSLEREPTREEFLDLVLGDTRTPTLGSKKEPPKPNPE